VSAVFRSILAIVLIYYRVSFDVMVQPSRNSTSMNCHSVRTVKTQRTQLAKPCYDTRSIIRIDRTASVRPIGCDLIKQESRAQVKPRSTGRGKSRGSPPGAAAGIFAFLVLLYQVQASGPPSGLLGKKTTQFLGFVERRLTVRPLGASDRTTIPTRSCAGPY